MNVSGSTPLGSAAQAGNPQLVASKLTVLGREPRKGRVGRLFSQPKTLIDDISLAIGAGELVAIVGPSGAGKSTLLRTLAGQLMPNSGSILLDKIPKRVLLSPGEIVGFLQQDNVLPRELPVGFAIESTTAIRQPYESINSIRRRVGDMATLTGLDEVVRRGGGPISGGEERRANLCAELVSDVTFLFLDEPTSSLDADHAIQITKVLKQRTDNDHSVVVATHEVLSFHLYDRVILLNNGRLEFSGSPSEALAHFGVEKPEEIYPLLRQETGDKISLEGAQEEIGQSTAKGQKPSSGLSSKKEPATEKKNATLDIDMPGARGLWDFAPNSSIIQWRQFATLLSRGLVAYRSDLRSILLILAQPILFGLIAMLIVRGDVFLRQHKADSILFTGSSTAFDLGPLWLIGLLATVAATMGLMNSHRGIVDERPLYNQEQFSGLRVRPYLLAKVTIWYVIAIAQTILLMLVLGLKIRFPTNDLLLDTRLEFGATIVLCILANINIGILISAVSNVPRHATFLSVVVLMIELAFGTVMAEQATGILKVLSSMVPTYWTYQALGTIVDINGLPEYYLLPPSPLFGHTQQLADYLQKCQAIFGSSEKCGTLFEKSTFLSAHLSSTWLNLVLLGSGFLVAALIVLVLQRRARRPNHIRVSLQ